MSLWPAPEPAAETFLAPAPQPALGPAPEQGGTPSSNSPSILAFPNGDEFVSSCANSSSPICYNTSISGANIITNLWFSSILGLICYLGFVAFRGKFRLYQARLNMPTVTHKPPAMRLNGLYRWWSWLVPVFTVSDEELLKSSGMDALIAVRVLSFGITVLLPITLAAMAILIPINYTDNYYKKSSQQAGLEDEYSTVFIRLTMSNITPGSSVLWVHFAFVYGAVFWTCWLITEQYKEYISLRQAYVIRNTEASSTHIGGSLDVVENERQPLITSRVSNRGFSFHPDVNGSHDEMEASKDDSGEKPNSGRSSLDFIQEMREVSLRRKNTPLRILYGEHQAKRRSSGRSVSFNFDKQYALHSKNVSGSSSISDLSTSEWSPETSFSTRSNIETSEENDSGGDPASRRVTISEQWMDHDFSVDVVDSSPKGEMPEVTSNEAADIQPHHGRMNSAAVAAALEYDCDASAAIALAKIRHHRAASGASSLSNTSATPSRSPRASPKKPESPFMSTILEKQRKPDGLTEIITVVAEDNVASAGHDVTELPTALALHPSMCDPMGQQGISHHWWSYMAEAGSGKIGKGSKAFVLPDVNIQSSASGDIGTSNPLDTITVNASLYTVLVTDEPIEKLRLKKPFRKSREFWQLPKRKSQIEAVDSAFDSVGGKRNEMNNNSKDTHIMAIATNDLEQGEVTRKHCHKPSHGMLKDENRDIVPSKSASERGMGITSGWSATISNLKQWWKHRGRYKEWRRDVRWAMFHRRARVATKMFTDLFGQDFDGLIPIYPTQSVDALITKWDKACAKLERAQYDLRILVEKENARRDELARGNMRSSCLPASSKADARLEKYSKKVSDLKKKITDLNAETIKLQDDIAEEREAILSDLPSTCFFATFKSQEAAAIAAQANLNPIKQRLLNVQPAPSPDDVNWPALTRSWWQRQSRPILVLPLILFIMLLPIGAFSGAFAQLTIAVCGSPAEDESSSSSWYCSDDPWANFFRNLVTSLAPTLLLSLYHMCILPVLVYYAAQAEGQHFSLSSLDRRCCSLFYYWDVFNVFLGAMLGGSLIADLPTYIQHPSRIWNALSAAIPASSNFFINYVAYRAFVMAWFRLWYPHMGTMVSFLKWIRILPWAKSPREKALEAPIRNCRYGRDIGIPVLMNFVMVLAYCVVSPLILPFGLLYFIFLWAVWRYQMLYVYQRQYESGGQFWPLVAHRVVGCLFICVLFTSVVLILKEAYTQAALMLVSLPLYLLRFDLYISSRYDAVVAQVPLMAVHKAGRVETIDPVVWTPPPLREGAEGWNPQWGMCWTFWGVPRYTV
jgi:hypothetical protein